MARLYSMPELLDRLGLPYNESGSDALKLKCPFCNHKKAKINVDLTKNAWRCPACGESGYTLNFFSLYHLGNHLYSTDPKEEKEKVAKELREFMDGPNAAPRDRVSNYKPRPAKPSVPVANDDLLNAVYTAMANLPELQLLPQHRENLRKRGLSDEAIDRNGYRSIPEKMTTDPCYSQFYESAGGEIRRTSTLNWLTSRQIRFGMMIAQKIICQGLHVEGVPGFFKFGDYWCYWCNPGILIPTRNIYGQIVIWQVRRDVMPSKGGTRYFTVASRGLPGHVTESVSRCHFPLSNAPLSRENAFIITEGPLKADVASHLYSADATFAAIPGIQTTKDLMRYVPMLNQAGICEVYNALDMDKLTNPNVRKGSDTLKRMFYSCGLRMTDMVWGKRYATSKLTALSLIANIRKVPFEATGSNVFEQLNIVANALDEAGIYTCRYINKSGKEITSYWDPTTKGIDDFLLNGE